MEERVFKSSQEQAVAAWTSFLHHLRVEELINKLASEDVNLQDALSYLEVVKEFVSDPNHILGSSLQKHGEVAEYLQVEFKNAASAVVGEKPIYEIADVGRLAMEDYLCDGKMVQSKFCQDTANTFKAVVNHLKVYPDFLKQGGTYDIPKEQRADLLRVLNTGDNARSQLSTHDDTLYKAIKAFEKENGVSVSDVIKPSEVTYKETQLNVVDNTISSKENDIRNINQERKTELQHEYGPSFSEGAKVAVQAAGIEAATEFVLKIYKIRKSGKKICEFSVADWQDVGLSTVGGAAKGGIRGGVLYLATNYTPVPAPVASALVSATYGVVAQARKLERGIISKDDFLENSEAICMDVTVSALSSALGTIIIPIPVLGTVIGNATGTLLYGIAQNYLSNFEEQIIADYQKETDDLISKWSDEYSELKSALNKTLLEYNSFAEFAFDEDVNNRMWSSIELARLAGVDEDKIIKTLEEGDAFFLQ